MNMVEFSANLRENCQLDPALPLVVGVSGGADSLCLLDSLARLGYSLLAAHFDHQLRPESSQDADVVRQAAAKLGVPFILGSEDVAAAARHEHLSLEEAARSLRYRFLFATARQAGAQAVAVGHTADDQVETILMHLLRGSGLSGLTGMQPRTLLPIFDPDLPVVRPLLATWRVETVACCQQRGLPFVQDASNLDPSFFRNRLRLELLPSLTEYNPQVKTVLWRMAQVLAGDEMLLEQAETAAWDECLLDLRQGAVALDIERLRACPLPMQRRLLRRAAAWLRPALRDVDFEAIQRGVDFVRAPSRSRQMDWLQALDLRVEPAAEGGSECSRLVVLDRDAANQTEPGWPQLGDKTLPLPVPGEIVIAPGWRLSAGLELPGESGLAPDTSWEVRLDADAVGRELWVRRPQPGDRFQPFGMGGRSQKLSDFWINHKLPRRARAAWPLVCSHDQVAWVPGYRLAHPFRVTPETQRVVLLQLKRSDRDIEPRESRER